LNSSDIEITRLAEDKISTELLSELAHLRKQCFPSRANISAYFKQLPHFRYIVYLNKKPVGQVGIDHRIMNFDGEIKRVYGLIDVCVAEAYRRRGLASLLLNTVMQDATDANIDMILLMADNPSLYKKHGYEFQNAECRWLGIDDEKLESLGVLVEKIDSELMVKRISSRFKRYRKIDFLGYMF